MTLADQAVEAGAGRQSMARARRRIRAKCHVQAEALRLFAERGYAQVTVDEIARAADISPRTFFRYFPSKEDVVLWDEYDEPSLREEVWGLPLAEDPLERTILILRKIIYDEYLADRDLLFARISIALSTPSVRARFVAQQIADAELMFSTIAGSWGMRAEDLDARVMAASLYAAVMVAVERWHSGGGRDDLGRLFDGAVRALAEGAWRLQPIGLRLPSSPG